MPMSEFQSTAFDDQPSLGQIQINHTVIAGIVRLAALQVKGVAGVGGGLVDGLSDIFAKRESSHRGVKVAEDGTDTYGIEIRLVIAYGSDIGKTACDVQVAVRKQVMAMTGKNVSRVDVIIEGVRLPAEMSPENRADDLWPEGPPAD
ncbi:MAG TPA: Asp23/Gls24 family envelope stress response protein [Opitutaceae bacterium]|nr:Asp23/Gls24 family envelope stress response protein [Opitutaceae bacterium]